MKAPRKPRDEVVDQIHAARLHIVEQALVAFLEDVLDRVPTDDELETKGFHVQFAATPISTFTKEDRTFTQFYVWDRQHAVALGFLNSNDLLELSIVRVPREEWPGALCAYTEQWKPGAP